MRDALIGMREIFSQYPQIHDF
jgi:hypothetical protein